MTNVAHRRRHTFAGYLDIEDRSPSVKHEYVCGEVFAIASGSIEHSALDTTFCGLLFAICGAALAGCTLWILGSGSVKRMSRRTRMLWWSAIRWSRILSHRLT